jgi:hypothetical protein
MPASRDPLVSDHHRNRVIESKRYDGRAPGGCTANDSRAVFAPLDMPWPSLKSRVEQSYMFYSPRIERPRLCALEAVAHSTGKAEILFTIRCAGSFGNDMVNLEPAEDIPLRTLAVLATMLRSLPHASD